MVIKEKEAQNAVSYEKAKKVNKAEDTLEQHRGKAVRDKTRSSKVSEVAGEKVKRGVARRNMWTGKICEKIGLEGGGAEGWGAGGGGGWRSM